MSIFGQCIAFIGGVTDEYCIGKDLEGSACGLVVTVSWNCVGGAGKSYKMS
jgi:hypothetical protein